MSWIVLESKFRFMYVTTSIIFGYQIIHRSIMRSWLAKLIVSVYLYGASLKLLSWNLAGLTLVLKCVYKMFLLQESKTKWQINSMHVVYMHLIQIDIYTCTCILHTRRHIMYPLRSLEMRWLFCSVGEFNL